MHGQSHVSVPRNQTFRAWGAQPVTPAGPQPPSPAQKVVLVQVLVKHLNHQLLAWNRGDDHLVGKNSADKADSLRLFSK